MKHIYFFGGNQTEGNKDLKDILGGKGANLAEMAEIGIPVPPGFTITTTTCKEYNDNDKKFSEPCIEEIALNVQKLEQTMGKKLGDTDDPLLLSIRSGAAISMPGMMDTVLNLGLNDKIVEGLARKTGNERFAWDSYRRFIQMFGDVVMGIPYDLFEVILNNVKESKHITYDKELDVEALKTLVEQYKILIHEQIGMDFPIDVNEQLMLAIQAVFDSWSNNRAIKYREINDITGLDGTAVNVQTMVFGNMGDDSGTGVCFTRDPSTGDNIFYGEYLMDAQGEDVVAGIRTPLHIDTLQKIMPECYDELFSICKRLEQHYKDMQDLEFTIQDRQLFMLQTRTGKRTAQAAVRIAVNMVNEGLITKEEALLRIEPKQLNQFLHKQLDPTIDIEDKLIGTGLPASPGASVGRIVFDNDSAVELSKEGDPVILVRNETSPEDIIGMDAAAGILTARGGMTSHAAVVARSMGKTCIAGCQDARIDESAKTMILGTQIFIQGDYITLQGSEGKIYSGKIPTTDPKISGDFSEILNWADEARCLKVCANADTPRDAEKAIELGAEGIGLCRTEHMFFEGSRIKSIRKMILAENVEQRKNALAEIKPFQKQDFIELLRIMDGRPVTIRLLDPPLHEFLPTDEDDIQDVAYELGVSVEKIKEVIEETKETNPMLGHRGCRIGISYPEIPEMQSQAIFEAARDVAAEGIEVNVEVMVPLVGHAGEFANQKKIILRVAKETIEDNQGVTYKIGSMIEIPRAALRAESIAEESEFFSFGTNDLTQMSSGFSRDDMGKFIPEYIKRGIFKADPFQTLDIGGVGQLMQIAIERGKSTRPDIKLGICGEHGGEPKSIEFCHKLGLDYVSCSPFQVPIARLAAAHAALKNK